LAITTVRDTNESNRGKNDLSPYTPAENIAAIYESAYENGMY